jgi:predicted lipoprotein with Yx(FWY)xxD motif
MTMNCRRPLTRADALRRRARRARLTALLSASAVSLGLTACGGGGGGGSEQDGAASVSSAASATVTVSKLPGYSSVLTTSSGQAVYLLTADPSGGSKCSASCATDWPPLLATQSLRAGPGVKASLLSTFKRADGKQQVMYNHHALYTHKGQGAASGAGLASDGGIWYLVSPSGSAVKSTSAGGY